MAEVVVAASVLGLPAWALLRSRQGEGRLDARLPVAVRIPPGLKEGAVFQVALDGPSVQSLLLTVHIRTREP